MSLTYIPFDIPGKLYRSPMPFAQFDPDNGVFDQYLDVGITSVVMLIEEGEDLLHAERDLKALYAQNKIKVIHFPIVDFDIPDNQKALDQLLNEVMDRAMRGERIAVHCFAGRGRTGFFLALLARRILNIDGQQAIDFLRMYFPAVETAAQEQLVIDYQLDE